MIIEIIAVVLMPFDKDIEIIAAIFMLYDTDINGILRCIKDWEE